MSTTKYLDSNGLEHFWGKIKDYVAESSIHFVIPNEKSSSAALTSTVDEIESLTPGLVVALRMPFDNVSGTTLNINNLGAKPIYYKSNTVDAGIFPAGSIALLIYEETSVVTGCFKAVYSYDTTFQEVVVTSSEPSSNTPGSMFIMIES